MDKEYILKLEKNEILFLYGLVFQKWDKLSKSNTSNIKAIVKDYDTKLLCKKLTYGIMKEIQHINGKK